MQKIWLLLAPVILQAGAASVSEPLAWRFAHSDAKILGGVEWKRISQLPMGASLRTFAKSADTPGMPASDMLDQLDRILFSSPGSPKGKNSSQPPILIIATGRFELAKFRQMALAEKAVIKPYKGAEFVYPPGYKAADSIVALVDAQTILIGEKAIVSAAIDKAKAVSGPLSASNRLFTMAGQSASEHDMWMVASVNPAEFYTAGDGSPQMPFMSDIIGAELGVDLKEGLGLGFLLATKSPEAAQGLAGVMKMMTSMASAQMPAQAAASQKQIQDIMQRLDIKAVASDVKMSIKIDEADLKKGMEQVLIAAMQPKPKTNLGGFQPPAGEQQTIRQVVPVDVSALARQSAPPKPIEPPAPPKKQVIRIEGLDEGPREIPYTTAPKP